MCYIYSTDTYGFYMPRKTCISSRTRTLACFHHAQQLLGLGVALLCGQSAFGLQVAQLVHNITSNKIG